MEPKPAPPADRWERGLRVARDALLMIVRWIEQELGMEPARNPRR
jgi:hypothetical protein